MTETKNNDFASSGLPAGYEALYNSNPYQNYQYQLGWWDKVGNFLGFRTSEDRTREEYAQRSNEYINQLQSLAREEEYNSESSQSERMKEAGINPALNGVNPSQASELNESPMSLPDITRNNADDVNSAFSTFTGIINTILGLGQGILSLNRTHLDNLSQKLRLNNESYNFGKLIGLDSVTTDGVKSLFGDDPEGLNSTESIYHNFRKLGFGRKAARQFAFWFNQGVSSRDSVAGQKKVVTDYNDLSDETARYEKNKRIGVSGLSISPALSETLGAISDYELKVMKLQLKYQSEYYENIKGKMAADAENMKNNYTTGSLKPYTEGDYFKIKAEYDSMMVKYQKDLIKLKQNVFNQIDVKHPLYKALLVAGFSGLETMASNPLSIVNSVSGLIKPPITKNFITKNNYFE